MKLRISCLTVVFLSLVLSATAQVTGSGTPGGIPIWTGSTTLGNSELFQTSGKVGIRTNTPTATLTVVGPGGGTVLQAIGGTPTAFSGKPGDGVTFVSGAGSNATDSGGGGGGSIQIAGGRPANPLGFVGGAGASIQISAGNGGSGGRDGASGGSITLQPGTGGLGGVISGGHGNLLLAPTIGNVGIGETSPANTLEVKIGGTTLADHWTTRSSLRFKTNIHPLRGALEKIEQLQGVSYDRRDDGRHEIGVVAEDVAQIVPEVVSRDPSTHEVEGVDYSRLAALLIEAVKSQQAEIQELKAQIEQLRSNPARQ